MGLRLLVADSLEDLTNLDSRVFRTFKELLFKPGFVSAEYVRGKRVRYLTPFRTYLAASLAFFLVGTVRGALRHAEVDLSEPVPTSQSGSAGDHQLRELARALAARGLPVDAEPDPAPSSTTAVSGEGARDEDNEVEEGTTATTARTSSAAESGGPIQVVGEISLGPLRVSAEDLQGSVEAYDRAQAALPPEERASAFQRAATRNAIRMANSPERLAERFFDHAPKTMFVLVPVHALLLALFYVRRRRYFAEHLVLSLHQHALVFLLLTGGSLVPRALGQGLGGADDALVTGLVAFHLVASLRTFYGQGWVRSGLKLLGIGFAYGLVLAVAMVTTLVLTLLFA